MERWVRERERERERERWIRWIFPTLESTLDQAGRQAAGGCSDEKPYLAEFFWCAARSWQRIDIQNGASSEIDKKKKRKGAQIFARSWATFGLMADRSNRHDSSLARSFVRLLVVVFVVVVVVDESCKWLKRSLEKERELVSAPLLDSTHYAHRPRFERA